MQRFIRLKIGLARPNFSVKIGSPGPLLVVRGYIVSLANTLHNHHGEEKLREGLTSDISLFHNKG